MILVRLASSSTRLLACAPAPSRVCHKLKALLLIAMLAMAEICHAQQDVRVSARLRQTNGFGSTDKDAQAKKAVHHWDVEAVKLSDEMMANPRFLDQEALRTGLTEVMMATSPSQNQSKIFAWQGHVEAMLRDLCEASLDKTTVGRPAQMARNHRISLGPSAPFCGQPRSNLWAGKQKRARLPAAAPDDVGGAPSNDEHTLSSTRKPIRYPLQAGASASKLAALALLFCVVYVYIDAPLTPNGAPLLARLACALLLGVIIAYAGYAKKSLDASGFASAWVVGTCTLAANQCYGAVLLAFFATSSALTRFGAARKQQLEDGYKKGGQRSWVQVVANGGIPTLLAILFSVSAASFVAPPMFFDGSVSSILSMAFVCYYSCCAGDTWASEIGVLSARKPLLITTLRPCMPGTNGGMSMLGTVASAGGGAACGIAACVAGAPPQVIAVCAAAGLVGSLVDSLLGATLQFSGWCSERKKVVNAPGPTVKKISGFNCLSNHAVNFLSATIVAGLGGALGASAR